MARAAAKTDAEETRDPFDPKRNPHLVGHEAAEQTVLEAWNAGRFPHAWLICGPRGIGKVTLAYRIARFVLESRGEGGGGASADGLAVSQSSQTFHLVSSEGHPDLRTLTRNMPKDDGKPTPTIINAYQTRRAVGFTYQTAAISRWHVVVVDPAEDFNTASANAILKALEEPPDRALFLLVSHAPGRLLPTIRSRCRKLQLQALPEETVVDLIARYRPETPTEEARLLARLSEGSVGAALGFAEAGGPELFAALTGLLARPKAPDMRAVSQLADKVAAKGREAAYDALVRLIDWWFKRLIRAGAVGEGPTPVDDGDAEALAALRAVGGVPDWIAMRDAATQRLAQAEPPANLDRRQLIFAVVTEWQRLAHGS